MANSKVFTIFAGVNGVGKSTLYHTLETDLGVRINTDEMVRKSGKDWRDLSAQLQAVKQLQTIQNDCIKKGISFNRETTVPGIGIERIIKEAKQNGFKVKLYFVNVESVDICKERVKARLEKGGHGVPDDVISYRYALINKRIAETLQHCDEAQFFDNSFDSIQLVGYTQNNSIAKVVDNCKWLNDLCSEYEKIKSSSSQDFQDFDFDMLTF